MPQQIKHNPRSNRLQNQQPQLNWLLKPYQLPYLNQKLRMVKLIWLWKNQVLLIFQMLLSSLGELSFHLLLDMNQLKKILNFISILLMMNF